MIQMFGHFFPKIYTRKNSPKIPLFLSKYDKLLQEQYYKLRVVWKVFFFFNFVMSKFENKIRKKKKYSNLHEKS